MNTMRAIVKRSEHANDYALMEIEIPQISGNEMLIRIKAIGVGIHDGYFLPPNISYPYPIGIEAAGIVEQVGEQVQHYRVGDEVAFISSMQIKGGTWAEYAVVSDDSLIVPIPKGMSFVEAAAVPVAGNTVLKAFLALQLKPKDSLFIAGASGAIGTFAIQIAVAQGCIVAGSASKRNHDYMMKLGASKTVDYHDSDWTDQIKQWMPGGVDAVMAIQPGTAMGSMDVVKDGGKIIAISGDQFMPQINIKAVQLPYQMNVRNVLIELMNLISSHEIKLKIEQTYSLENALAALQKTGTRRARGKLVIDLL